MSKYAKEELAYWESVDPNAVAKFHCRSAAVALGRAASIVESDLDGAKDLISAARQDMLYAERIVEGL